jgi:dihydroxyacid dehydratase/phosphogluconate dehydratase
MPPQRAQERGLTGTIAICQGNLAPQGSVIKSTAIDPSLVDADGVYRKTGPARVFIGERAGIQAIRTATSTPATSWCDLCEPLAAGWRDTPVTGA